MNKFLIVFSLLLLAFATADAQRYPVPVLSGSELKITSDKGTQTITVKNDTLWVFNGSQFKAALTKAKELELAEEQIKRYTMQAEVYKARSNEKDSMISVLKSDRDYYKSNFKMCTEDIETQIKKNRRKSLFNKLAIAGIPVAFLAGFFLAK